MREPSVGELFPETAGEYLGCDVLCKDSGTVVAADIMKRGRAYGLGRLYIGK